MANLSDLKKRFNTGQYRTLGAKFQKDIVNRIENNEYSVSDISNLNGVSKTSIYR